jgi:hypothetical protein
MFSRIIVGTCLSDVSSKTLCCLKGLRQAGAKEVILAHAMNNRGVGSLYSQLRNLVEPIFLEQKHTLEQIGFSVSI